MPTEIETIREQCARGLGGVRIAKLDAYVFPFNDDDEAALPCGDWRPDTDPAQAALLMADVDRRGWDWGVAGNSDECSALIIIDGAVHRCHLLEGAWTEALARAYAEAVGEEGE